MQKQLKIPLISQAIGLTLLGLSFTAQASVISASSVWTLDGNPGTGSPDIDGPTGANSVDVLGGSSDSAGNSVFYHTYGNTSGTFGSRVSGNNNFDISNVFNFMETYQNTSLSAQNAFFDFTIIPGEIDLNFFGDALASGNFLTAGYEIDIRVGGNSVWDSTYTIALDSNNVFTSNGTGSSINGTLDNANQRYSWSSFNGNVDLGLFDAGETFLLEYDLRTFASGNMTGATNCTFGGGDGEGGPVAFAVGDDRLVIDDEGEGGYYSNDCGSAIARSGDPFDPTFGNTSSVTGASAVPEPSVLLLFGLGFAGLFAARKKQI